MSHTHTTAQADLPSEKVVLWSETDSLLQKLYKRTSNTRYFLFCRTKYEKAYGEIALKYNTFKENYFFWWQRRVYNGLKRSENFLKDLAYPPTIYNALLDVWFTLAAPFEESDFSQEEFIGKLVKVYGMDYERIFPGDPAKNFYESASKIWVDMIAPSKEVIREKSLQIAAGAIFLDFKLKDNQFEVLAPAVFELIAGNKNHFSSFQGFVEILCQKSGKKIYTLIHQYTQAARAFYDFAKRFYFEQFPSKFCDQSTRKFVLLVAKNKAKCSMELLLLQIDRVLSWLCEYSDVQYKPETLPIDVSERLRYITQKSVFVSRKNFERTITWLQETQGYKKIDGYIGFEDRYNELRSVYQMMYDLIEARIYDPAVQGISAVYDNLSRQWRFIVRNVDERVLIRQRKYLFSKYKFLKDSIISLKDQVLEIRLDKESLQKYSKNLREQLLCFIGEIKELNQDKIKIIGSQIYRKALENVKAALPHFRRVEIELSNTVSGSQQNPETSTDQKTENKDSTDSLQKSKRQERTKKSDDLKSHQTGEEKNEPKQIFTSKSTKSPRTENEENIVNDQFKEIELTNKVEEHSDAGGRPGSQTTENSSHEDIPHPENSGSRSEIEDSEKRKGHAKTHENSETVIAHD